MGGMALRSVGSRGGEFMMVTQRYDEIARESSVQRVDQIGIAKRSVDIFTRKHAHDAAIRTEKDAGRLRRIAAAKGDETGSGRIALCRLGPQILDLGP